MPRCGTKIEAVFFSEHVTNYCPQGADRRARAEGPAAIAVAQVNGALGSLTGQATGRREMSERSEYGPGEFCWIDLSTPDVEAATTFYSDLLGVDAEADPGGPEETGGYGFFKRDSKMVAASGRCRRAGDGPPSWNSWIKVENATEAADKVTAVGGNVGERRPSCPETRDGSASASDPEGAYLRIMSRSLRPGARIRQRGRCLDLQPAPDPRPESSRRVLRRRVRLGVQARRGGSRRGPVLSDPDRGPEVPGGRRRGDGHRGADARRGPGPLARLPRRPRRRHRGEDQGRRRPGDFPPTDINIRSIAGVADAQGAGFTVFKPDLPEPR